MGFFDQTRLAANLMKHMDASQMKEMMEQAKEAQKMMEWQIRKIVQEEIERRGLVSKEEVEKMVKNIK